MRVQYERLLHGGMSQPLTMLAMDTMEAGPGVAALRIG